MVAHNAKFDRSMIEGELRRWRFSEKLDRNQSQDLLPRSLSEVFDSSVDSLRLFKDRRMWKTFTKPTSLPMPSTFKLGCIYNHVFGVSITHSHNAVADIQALDRLLMHETMFYGWKDIANEIQMPFIKIRSTT